MIRHYLLTISNQRLTLRCQEWDIKVNPETIHEAIEVAQMDSSTVDLKIRFWGVEPLSRLEIRRYFLSHPRFGNVHVEVDTSYHGPQTQNIVGIQE